jgi:hypothetical protein
MPEKIFCDDWDISVEFGGSKKDKKDKKGKMVAPHLTVV